MSVPGNQEPPAEVRYLLEEALDLLGTLEEVRDAFITTDQLAEVSEVECHVRLLNRRLGFDKNGGSNG